MTKRKDDIPNQGTQKVGYGRPPKHARFKPGQSGNPGGRPKKRKPKIYNKQELEKLIVATGNQTIKIMKDGKPMDITMIQAIFEQLHRKAIQGDQRSIKMVIDMQMKTFASVDEARLKMAEMAMNLEDAADRIIEEAKANGQPVDKEKLRMISSYRDEALRRVNENLED